MLTERQLSGRQFGLIQGKGHNSLPDLIGNAVPDPTRVWPAILEPGLTKRLVAVVPAVLLSHLHSLTIQMSQKSSVTKTPQSVPQALIPDTPLM